MKFIYGIKFHFARNTASRHTSSCVTIPHLFLQLLKSKTENSCRYSLTGVTYADATTLTKRYLTFQRHSWPGTAVPRRRLPSSIAHCTADIRTRVIPRTNSYRGLKFINVRSKNMEQSAVDTQTAWHKFCCV